jgi:hypothetical protein
MILLDVCLLVLYVRNWLHIREFIKEFTHFNGSESCGQYWIHVALAAMCLQETFPACFVFELLQYYFQYHFKIINA